ncbi:MAG: sn-glycerol-3-phosphate import ATP-binding protein UgpC [Pseudomonadota bacterium]
MATVGLENVKKRFGKTEVIHGIDVEIKDGEFIVIVGPSGCGKSTLLRMVAGLESVSEGEVRIGGKRVNEMEPMERDIAMVFQNYALYPHMSVRQNMAYSLKIAKVSSAEIDRKVQEAADLLQLTPYLDRKPRQLSGGQRQRVAMGRAIVREPSVFLFDEPLSNLDAKLRVQMRLEIKELQSKLGITSLYVTHDQVEAMTMADRMIVMNDGIAEQIGTPLEVYETPQTLFAAQFIGSPAMNVINGTIANGTAELEGGARLAVTSSLQGHQGLQGDVSVGVRPEHLVPDPEGPFRLDIGLVEPIGANTLLHGRLDGTDHPFTASLSGIHNTLQAGKVMTFSADPAHLHFFNRASGERIG